MATMTIEEVQGQLEQLIAGMKPGEEVLITRNDKLVARLVAEGKMPPGPRQLGTMKGSVLYMAADFDAPLEDFEEYMR